MGNYIETEENIETENIEIEENIEKRINDIQVCFNEVYENYKGIDKDFELFVYLMSYIRNGCKENKMYYCKNDNIINKYNNKFPKYVTVDNLIFLKDKSEYRMFYKKLLKIISILCITIDKYTKLKKNTDDDNDDTYLLSQIANYRKLYNIRGRYQNLGVIQENNNIEDIEKLNKKIQEIKNKLKNDTITEEEKEKLTKEEKKLTIKKRQIQRPQTIQPRDLRRSKSTKSINKVKQSITKDEEREIIKKSKDIEDRIYEYHCKTFFKKKYRRITFYFDDVEEEEDIDIDQFNDYYIDLLNFLFENICEIICSMKILPHINCNHSYKHYIPKNIPNYKEDKIFKKFIGIIPFKEVRKDFEEFVIKLILIKPSTYIEIDDDDDDDF
jgi:hypothetical protein